MNKAFIIGNLGADPDLRHTQSGEPVASLRIATTEHWTTQDGQKKESTEWHRVSFWGRLAEIADQYLTKGSKVAIVGKIQTRKWQDQQGQDRYTTEIVGRELEMLDSRGDRQPSGNAGQPDPAHKQAAAVDQFEDDIPF